MDIYANDFLNLKEDKRNMDKSIEKQKMKLMKMKKQMDKSIEKQTMKLMKKSRKNEDIKIKKQKAMESKKAKLNRKQEKKNKKYSNNKIENKQEINKKRIKNPKTIPNTRLTEPKKRFLLRRVMLQTQYNRGDFDYVEEVYNDLTREEMLDYKNSKFRDDKIYYKMVQAYEDAKDDVTVRRGWTTFKLGLATVMLVSSMSAIKNSIKEVHDLSEKNQIEITLENASQQQIDNAIMNFTLLEVSCGYEFENLTQDEKVDAMFKIPTIESKMSKGQFQNALMTFKDQELLNTILIESFGEEVYNTYTEEKKDDLRKLAYELLEKEQKDCLRDPQVLKEIENKEQTQLDNSLNGNISTIDKEFDDR